MNPNVQPSRAEQQEIDASARWPVVAFLGAGLFWLIAGGALQLAANIQLHTPAFLADCAWFTHGRLAPAAQNALVYGWGFNAAFAVGLWLMARLSATTLRHGGWLFIAAKFWNLGVVLGLGGILGGYSTSFDLLEMPRYVSLLLLGAYALIGVWGVTTFSIRNTENVYASQWYLFGAAFWFPWVYSIAQVMLFTAPVRGVLQPVVNAWYVHSVFGLWFLPATLAVIYYLLPKLLGRPISQYYLAPLAFWWFVVATAFAGGARLIGGPVPVWIPTLGTVANLAVLLPVTILGLNFLGTLAGRWSAVGGSLSLRFVVLAIAGFFLNALVNVLLSLRAFAEVAQFTLFAGLRDWTALYAAFSVAAFGAAYFLLPRVTGKEWRSSALIKAHFGATVVGILLVLAGLGAGGWQHGALLGDAAVAFGDITRALSGWHLVNTVGFGVLLVGHLAFVINFIWIACPINSQGTASVTIPVPPALGLATKEGQA
jgi:cytochrome c oxidase cbb3-type subunit 1